MSQHPLNHIPVIERFIDYNPHNDYEKVITTHLTDEELQSSIRASLENLLNTRSRLLLSAGAGEEVKHSVINYGIQDFSHTYFGNRRAQELMCSMIKQSIEYFEPRLERITVSIVGDDHELRLLQIRIEATIAYQAMSQHAIFESSLDLSRQRFLFESY